MGLSRCVLIATRDCALADALREAIVAAGGSSHRVHRATDTRAAIYLVSELEPCVVYMDSQLPGFEQAIARIRCDEPRTTVVLLTGQPEREALPSVVACGARDSLSRRNLSTPAVARTLRRSDEAAGRAHGTGAMERPSRSRATVAGARHATAAESPV